MAGKWSEFELGDLGTIVTGKTPSSKITNAFGEGMPFVTPRDMDGRRWIEMTERSLTSRGVDVVKNSVVPQNSVAVSCIGSDMGKTVLLRKESVTNQQINSIIVNQQCFDYRFVYYNLSYRQNELKNLASGSATPILSKSLFSKVSFSCPDILEQKAIADVLSALDDKIELNRRMNETLESIARTLFKDWFIDFGPVKAKAAGQPPPGLDDDIAALFPDALDEEGIPLGWEKVKLMEVTSLLKRGLQPKYIEEEGVLVINQKCIRDRKIDFKPARRHNDSEKPIKDRQIFEGDMLVNSTGVGTLGRVAPVRYLPETTIVDSHVTIARPDTEKISKLFFAYQMLYRQPDIEAMGHGSTGQTELSRVTLGESELIKPGYLIQEKFDEIIQPFEDQLIHNELENLTLTKLRDTLLPKLISGEVRVQDIEEVA